MKNIYLLSILFNVIGYNSNAQTELICKPADKVQYILKWYAHNEPRKYIYHDNYIDGKLDYCSMYEPKVYSLVHNKMISINKIYVFSGDTLNRIEIQYVKNISTAEVTTEYDNDNFKKIGSFYFSRDLKYCWEIKYLTEKQFPIVICRLVKINKLPKEIKTEYEKELKEVTKMD